MRHHSVYARRRHAAYVRKQLRPDPRPVEIVEAADPDPTSWGSRCAAQGGDVHERLRIEVDGRWRCRWCFQCFRPPMRKGDQ